MSFLSGPPWQQPSILTGNGGYGPASRGLRGQLQQDQQHQPPDVLPGANHPAALASSPLSPSSSTSAWQSDWHGQGQMASEGLPQEESRITLSDDKVKLGHGWTEETSSGTQVHGSPGLRTPMLKIEDEGATAGRFREEWGAAGSLGSAGQSPSSPHSSSSSYSSSPLLPSPFVSAGQSFLSSRLDSEPTLDPTSGPSNSQQNFTNALTNLARETMENRNGSFLQQSPVGQDVLLPNQASRKVEEVSTCHVPVTGITRSSPESREDKRGSVDPLGNVKNDFTGQTGSPTLKSSSGQQCLHVLPPDTTSPAMVLTGSKAALTESGNVTHEPYAIPNREIKSSQIREPPQRNVVRRAMSDCSHLSVPILQAETYPNSMGRSPAITPDLSQFARGGAAGPARVPYPHMAVRRSFTVTNGTEATTALATMLSSPLMTPPVWPSSPPPKRHHGTCESNVLLPVPAPAIPTVESTQGSKVNMMGKSCFFFVS